MTFFNSFRIYTGLTLIFVVMLVTTFFQPNYFRVSEGLLFIFLSLFIIDGGITVIRLKRTAYDTPENSAPDFSTMTPGTDAHGVLGILIANLIGPFLRNKSGIPAVIIGSLVIILGIGLMIWTVKSFIL